MKNSNRRIDYNLIIFLALVCIYIAGQLLIGTYDTQKDEFRYDAPADTDFLYYAAIINSVGAGGGSATFPPENPALAGTKLTQPFLQYYPAAILAKIVGPYNAIRILNLIYLVLFGFLLKNLFPKNYALPLLIIFAGSTYSTYINALGIDLISRGFTHTPFFILLAIALFGKSIKVRSISIFVAALLNGYMMLMILPFLVICHIFEIKSHRQYLYLLGAGVLGLIIASLFVMSEAVEKHSFFIIAESFSFAPLEILKHAGPVIILAILYRHIKSYILLGMAILFGALIHYNPFFPVFLVYFSGAMMLADGKPRFEKTNLLSSVLLGLMFVSFIILTYSKFDPDNKIYYPRYDDKISKSIEWIKNSTSGDAKFTAINADQNDLALIMQYRPVYLGPIELVAHLGLNWQPRYEAIMKLYRFGKVPDGIDYIYYGPVEQKYFPGLELSNSDVSLSYQDDYVTIYEAKK